MRLTVQYRDRVGGAWKLSKMTWRFEDINLLNKTVGYEKYRVVRVVAS
ncbi:hypothetical protein [Microbacterium testaceum]|nr:hypothetical protein [Microbacterium testaceum]MCC4250789.1 hypothetical protein [Microbacterium testaceum]